MAGGTFQYFYNESVVFINGLTQIAGIGAMRRLIMSNKWCRSGKHDQSRADKDRTDSLIILEDRHERKDITKVEYEIMKSVLSGKGNTDKL